MGEDHAISVTGCTAVRVTGVVQQYPRQHAPSILSGWAQALSEHCCVAMDDATACELLGGVGGRPAKILVVWVAGRQRIDEMDLVGPAERPGGSGRARSMPVSIRISLGRAGRFSRSQSAETLRSRYYTAPGSASAWLRTSLA